MRGIALVSGLLVVTASALAAQDGERSEAAFLREAAAHEARGDLDVAADVLGRLLERRPASSAGLFALERILRSRGTLAEVLPFADRYLEVEPGAAGTRYLKLRVMVELDSLETLEAEAGRWIDSDPGSPEPWREIARMYERAFGPERALALLQEGRETLDGPHALALEIGDVLLELDRPADAVEAWSRAIGPEGSDASAVLDRLGGLGEDGTERVRTLVSALGAEPTTPERRRAGARIALEWGLTREALELAEGTLSELPTTGRRGFLVDLARRGDEAGANEVTLWAYDELRGLTDDDRERRALDERIAAAALAAADTSRALEAQSRLARGLPAGSPERRRVVADLIRVEAGRSDPEELTRRLDGFRREFPDAAELDELAAAVAAGLQVRGEEAAADRILEGVDGPRSSLERGYLLLERGELEQARAVFGEAVPGLAPARATPVIQLVGLLGRLAPAGRAVVAESAVLAHRERGGEAVQRARDGVAGVPPAEQATVLAHGARLADESGLPDEAAELRAELLASHPDAPEVGEATLALARYRARDPEGVEEAVRLLETLILERPNAPVVPDARRELERLRRRGEAGLR